MKAERPSDEELDKILKRALADDLPADAEAGMRRTIARFREKTMKGEAEGGERATRAAGAAWIWILGRGAAAVLSILMLLAGILLQGRGSRNDLAGRIARVKTEFNQEMR